jgi:hypothetical protein
MTNELQTKCGREKSKQTLGRRPNNTNHLAFLCNRGGKRPYAEGRVQSGSRGAARLYSWETKRNMLRNPKRDHQMYLETSQLDLTPKIFVYSHLRHQEEGAYRRRGLPFPVPDHSHER